MQIFPFVLAAVLLAVLVLVPALARASTRVGGSVVSGPITIEPSTAKLKPSDVNCTDLVVQARAGGGAIVASAHAAPGVMKGECVYSLKVPPGDDLSLGVAEVRYGIHSPRDPHSGAPRDKGQVSPADVVTEKMGPGHDNSRRYDKWRPVPDGNELVKGEYIKLEYLKLDSLKVKYGGNSSRATMPLIVKISEPAS